MMCDLTNMMMNNQFLEARVERISSLATKTCHLSVFCGCALEEQIPASEEEEFSDTK